MARMMWPRDSPLSLGLVPVLPLTLVTITVSLRRGPSAAPSSRSASLLE